MPVPQEIREAGARNSASDKKLIQSMHDGSTKLGADCGVNESLQDSLKEASVILFGDSHDARRQAIARAVRAKFTDAYGYYDGPYVYVRDMFDDLVIVDKGNDLFAIPYSMDADGKVALGDPTEVECAYVPVTGTETDELESLRAKPGVKVRERGKKQPAIAGAIELRESATVDTTGMLPLKEAAASAIKTIKMIQPGWGSSGYYAKEVLKRDGPKAFPKETQMFWNHQTEAEESARPEGNLDNLAAVTVSPARWMDNGPAGAGLYAEAKVFSDYADKVTEKGPHIGVSIRALGKASMGEAEGRKGPIIESLNIGKSTDFVTKAGAGGQVLIEAARPAQQQQQQAAESSRISQPGAVDMDEKDIQSLREAAANATAKAEKLAQDLARLQGRALVSEARGFIATKLQAVELPDVTKNLITNRESVNPPAKEDGMLDTAKFSTQIDEAVKTEAAYLAQVQGSGQVKNLGAAATAPTQIDEAKLDEQINAAFAGMGLSESAAKIAAKGRV